MPQVNGETLNQCWGKKFKELNPGLYHELEQGNALAATGFSALGIGALGVSGAAAIADGAQGSGTSFSGRLGRLALRLGTLDMVANSLSEYL